jgi:hypothetical protein
LLEAPNLLQVLLGREWGCIFGVCDYGDRAKNSRREKRANDEPRGMFGKVPTPDDPSVPLRETCEHRDKPGSGRIERCHAGCSCRGYRVPSFVMRG